MRLGAAEVVFTGRDEGDLGHAGVWVDGEEVDPAVEARRRAVVDRPWSWLRQVHGDDVVVVDAPGGAAGRPGDALVTAAAGTALAVLTADCAPVAFAADNGVIAVAHAGWRGLVAGIIEETVEAMRGLGAEGVVAALGPCIHPECYEFSPGDLDDVAGRLGEGVRGLTSDGRPALDVPAAVRTVLARCGVDLAHDAGVCTACSSTHFSYRARRETEREATVVWVP